VRSRVVGIKPNVTYATAGDISRVTQAPYGLCSVSSNDLEPRELIVSGGTGGAETADVFRLAGLLDVMREEQAEFLDQRRSIWPTHQAGRPRARGGGHGQPRA